MKLTTKEAAEYLRMSESSLRYWRQNNIGPAYRKYGRAVRYLKEDLDEYDKKAVVLN